MRLDRYLLKNKMTAYSFASDSGVNEKAVYRIIEGRVGMTLKTAKMVVKATDGDVGFLDLPDGGEDGEN